MSQFAILLICDLCSRLQERRYLLLKGSAVVADLLLRHLQLVDIKYTKPILHEREMHTADLQNIHLLWKTGGCL